MNLICFALLFTFIVNCQSTIPIVINTWDFQHATVEAWRAVNDYSQSAIDAVVEGCSVCEREQCDTTVGYGGSPDENGETTLDAMIMDGKTMNIGAVAALREIKDVIAVAKHVLENTKHTLLVGDQATEFAVAMGFQRESLATTQSQDVWQNWKTRNCQPNFWLNVVPNPSISCGPYTPTSQNDIKKFWSNEINNNNNAVFDKYNHDTIGMIVIDKENNIAAGTSTNGAKHKIPGRVGDSPIPGAGAYADNSVGAAVATGDGDIMLRFLPSLLAVEDLRRGVSPSNAGANAFRRIAQYYPEFQGGIVVVKNDGTYGAACHGLSQFPYSVYTAEKGNVVETVNCI